MILNLNKDISRHKKLDKDFESLPNGESLIVYRYRFSEALKSSMSGSAYRAVTFMLLCPQTFAT